MRRFAALLLFASTACGGASQSSTPPSKSEPPAGAVENPPADPPGSNFASPPGVESPAEPAPANEEDPELARKVREKFGADCRLERTCGEMVGVDCNSAADGPYYYARRENLETVSTCGGACMGGGCTNCGSAANASTNPGTGCNASTNPSVNGTSLHYYKQGDLVLAQSLQGSVVAGTGRANRGVQKNRFYVLAHTRMPAVLIETAFLTNSNEGGLLSQPEYRQRCCCSRATN